jgi:hypothetical protein
VNASRAGAGVDVSANMEKILAISQSIIDRWIISFRNPFLPTYFFFVKSI